VARARGRAVLGTVEGVAAGFEPDPAGARAGEGLAAAVATALGEAGVAPSEVRALVLGRTARARGPRGAGAGGVAPGRSSAQGTSGRLRRGGCLGAPRRACGGGPERRWLVLDVCASGHVAALVARAGDAA